MCPSSSSPQFYSLIFWAHRCGSPSSLRNRNLEDEPSLQSPFLLCSTTPLNYRAPSFDGQDAQQPRHFANARWKLSPALLPQGFVPLGNQVRKLLFFFRSTPPPGSSHFSNPFPHSPPQIPPRDGVKTLLCFQGWILS